MKCDAYLIDCNVNGSDEGTSNNPKFSLLTVFRDQVFPKIGKLVGPGGAYEGYLPVFQGDNAGPHVDGTFHTFVKDFCESKGWKWELQAAQMPHSNNLDLAAFPMMLKHHSVLLKMYSTLQAQSGAHLRKYGQAWGLQRLLADSSWHIASPEGH
jgi:hypothetical protein